MKKESARDWMRSMLEHFGHEDPDSILPPESDAATWGVDLPQDDNDSEDEDDEIADAVESTYGAIISEVPGFKPLGDMFADTPELEEDLEPGKPLHDVLEFFGIIMDEFDLHDSFFFSPTVAEIQQEFVREFLLFKARVDKRIAEFAAEKDQYPHQDFSDGWEERQKKAAYFAFFLHYGEKRKYDRDEHDRPKGYIEHLYDAVFNRLFGDMAFFHELTALVVWCHDTKENFSRGIFALLSAKNIEDLEKAASGKAREMSNYESQIVPKTERFHRHLDDFLDELEPPHYHKLFETDKSVLAYLVEGVTKGIDADRLQGCTKLCDFLTSEMGEPFIDAGSDVDYRWLLLAVKLADRLSNSRDYKAGLQKLSPNDQSFTSVASKVKKLETETVLVYIVIAEILEMNNVADQLRADIKGEKHCPKPSIHSRLHGAFFENNDEARQELMDLCSIMSEMAMYDNGDETNITVQPSEEHDEDFDGYADYEDYLPNVEAGYYIPASELEILEDPTYMKQVNEIDFFLDLAGYYFRRLGRDFVEEPWNDRENRVINYWAEDIEDRIKKTVHFRKLLLGE